MNFKVICTPGECYPITNCHISMLIYCLGQYVSRKKSINERCMELYLKAVSKLDKQTLNAIRDNPEEYGFLINGLKAISELDKQTLNAFCDNADNAEEYNFLISELSFFPDLKRSFLKNTMFLKEINF